MNLITLIFVISLLVAPEVYVMYFYGIYLFVKAILSLLKDFVEFIVSLIKKGSDSDNS